MDDLQERFRAIQEEERFGRNGALIELSVSQEHARTMHLSAPLIVRHRMEEMRGVGMQGLAWARQTKGRVRVLLEFFERGLPPDSIGTTREEIDALHEQDIRRVMDILGALPDTLRASDVHELRELLKHQVTFEELLHRGITKANVENFEHEWHRRDAVQLLEAWRAQQTPLSFLTLFQYLVLQDVTAEELACTAEECAKLRRMQ